MTPSGRPRSRAPSTGAEVPHGQHQPGPVDERPQPGLADEQDVGVRGGARLRRTALLHDGLVTAAGERRVEAGPRGAAAEEAAQVHIDDRFAGARQRGVDGVEFVRVGGKLPGQRADLVHPRGQLCSRVLQSGVTTEQERVTEQRGLVLAMRR